MVKEIHVTMNDKDFFRLLKIKKDVSETGNVMTWRDFLFYIERRLK